MAILRDDVLALIEDLRKPTPMERLLAVKTETERDRWGIEFFLPRHGKKSIAVFGWKNIIKRTSSIPLAKRGNFMSPDSETPALVGVEPTLFPKNGTAQRPPPKVPFLRNTWYVVTVADEMKGGELMHRTIMNEPIAFYRKEDGGIAAFTDRCPHRSVPLSMGKLLAGDRVQCIYHGLEFGADGKCILNPHGSGKVSDALHRKESEPWRSQGPVAQASQAQRPHHATAAHKSPRKQRPFVANAQALGQQHGGHEGKPEHGPQPQAPQRQE